MSLQVIRVESGVFQHGTFRPTSDLTDRAKRYRANHNVAPSKNCFACGQPNPRDVHHIDGHEDNEDRRNLAKCCRACNTRIANVMRKAGLGKKTRQYNPKGKVSRGREGAASLGAYLSAVQIVRGDQPGNVSSAVKLLQSTTPHQRSEYAKRIWRIRRERYGPTGRQDSLPF